MIPLVAFAPLPRLDIGNAVIQSDLFPALLIVNPDQSRAVSPGSASGEGLDAGPVPGDRSPSTTTPITTWLMRCLTLIGLLGAGVGLAWLVLGCLGVRWLIRHAQNRRRERERYMRVCELGWIGGMPARRCVCHHGWRGRSWLGWSVRQS